MVSEIIFCLHRQNLVLLSSRKQKWILYRNSPLLLQYVFIFCRLHTKSIKLPSCSSLAACIPQGHMNKDHSDDTKLIVQHSTNVKASVIQSLFAWCLLAKKTWCLVMNMTLQDTVCYKATPTYICLWLVRQLYYVCSVCFVFSFFLLLNN